MVALLSVVFSSLFVGNGLGAQAVFAEGRRRFEADGATDWLACVLHHYGFWIAHMTGDHDTARTEGAEILSCARRTGSPTLLAGALGVRARLLSEEDPDEALASAAESIQLVQNGAGNWAYSPALQVPALLLSARGDSAAARAVHTAVEYQALLGNRLQMSIDLAVAVLVLASRKDAFESAATLAGAVSGPTLRDLPALTGSGDRKRYDQNLAVVAAHLGAAAYAQAQQRGAAMTYDEIVAYTLEQLNRLAGSSAEPNR